MYCLRASQLPSQLILFNFMIFLKNYISPGKMATVCSVCTAREWNIIDISCCNEGTMKQYASIALKFLNRIERGVRLTVVIKCLGN